MNFLSRELTTSTGIAAPCNHAVEVFPEGWSPSCSSSCRIPACSHLSESLWGELRCLCDGEEWEESRQNRLKIISAELGCRIWGKTTVIGYCTVKTNITVSSHSQQWVLNPSANGLCQLSSSSPGLSSQVWILYHWYTFHLSFFSLCFSPCYSVFGLLVYAAGTKLPYLFLIWPLHRRQVKCRYNWGT